jgi:hypothetical protein
MGSACVGLEVRNRVSRPTKDECSVANRRMVLYQRAVFNPELEKVHCLLPGIVFIVVFDRGFRAAKRMFVRLTKSLNDSVFGRVQ